MKMMLAENNPPDLHASFSVLFIDADYDVYPNCAEPAEWWRLGNLQSDGVDIIIKAFRDQTAPGIVNNRSKPLKELARRYGDAQSTRMYHKSDLVCRWMHQWGLDYMNR